MTDIIPGAAAAPELCCVLTAYEPEHHPKSAIVSQKFNGIRCLWIGGQMVSREGSPMECAEHARAELQELQDEFGQPQFFDMELVVDGSLSATLSAFRSRRPAGLLHLFDAVPLETWLKNTPKGCPPLIERLERLDDALQANALHNIVRPVMFNRDVDVADARRFYERVVGAGLEGIVIKDATAPYYRGRSKAWMKLTPEVLRKQKLKELTNAR